MLAPTRRGLVASTGAIAAAAILGKFGIAVGQSSRSPFTLGVASGEPSSDGFVIWTRLAPQPLAADGRGGLSEPVAVSWEVASDASMRRIVRGGTAEAHPNWGHSVHVEVDGLRPNRPYWYRFTALGIESAIGRSRTAPAPTDDLSRLRFAFASCANWELGYFSAYRHMAEENPDLVLFLGDYIYETTLNKANAHRVVRPHDGPQALNLAGYRNRHALYKTDADLQALHATAPCLVTWDDHEVENDYAAEWSQRVNVYPPTFLKRRTAAYQAFYEHMPLRARARPNGHAMHLYNSVRFGTLAAFPVLDLRQYRSIQPCAQPVFRSGHVAPENCPDLVDPKRTMLGGAQERWLFEGFKRAETAWTIIVQSVLVAQLRRKDKAGMMGLWTDTWDGYQAGRQRMFDALTSSRVANPVFIGGDFHSFWATELKADFNDPRSPTIATELLGTSITSDGPSYQRLRAVLPENPHIRFFDSRQRGFVSVDLTRRRMEARFQVISDRRDASARLSTLRRFVVEAGRAGPIELK